MTDDHDAEMDALAAQLEAAGIITIRTNEAGQIEYQLTDTGTQFGRRLAMTGDEDEALAMLQALMVDGQA
jgi:hypothetical protein